MCNYFNKKLNINEPVGQKTSVHLQVKTEWEK